LNEAAEFIPEEKETAIRVVEDINGLFADETEVDRDENSAGLDRGEIGLNKGDGVVKEGGDLIAFFHPETKKPMGQVIHPEIKILIGAPLVTTNKSGSSGKFLGDHSQDLADIHIRSS
jgi:hypothetical protein